MNACMSVVGGSGLTIKMHSYYEHCVTDKSMGAKEVNDWYDRFDEEFGSYKLIQRF